MTSPEKIILYSAERPDLKMVMQLYFNEAGTLFFDGCDTGTFVKETFGSFDYEYTFSVPPAEAEKFYHLFNLPTGNRESLLVRLKDHFGVNEGYSKMRTYMTENGIKYETFIWH